MSRARILNVVASLAGILGTVLAFWTVVSAQSNDAEQMRQLQIQFHRAPKLDYPKRDLRNRPIPAFNQLAVFPECQSCSDFRKKCFAYAKAKPESIILILTPDMNGLTIESIPNNCYVFHYTQDSAFNKLNPGFYSR